MRIDILCRLRELWVSCERFLLLIAVSLCGAACFGADAAEKSPSDESRKIAAGDVLIVDIMTNFSDSPWAVLLQPAIEAIVDSQEKISLGSRYGTVTLAGKTIEQAERQIESTLSETVEGAMRQALGADDETAKAIQQQFRQINVRVTTAESEHEKLSADQQPASQLAAGEPRPLQIGDVLHVEASIGTGAAADVKSVAIVEPSGQVALGVRYGRVKVMGKNLEEAERAIHDRIAEIYKDPEVQVTYAGRASDDDLYSVSKLQREISELKKTIHDLQNARPTSLSRGNNVGGGVF